MKKILLTTCILSLMLGTKALAADTYTGSFVESLSNKINAVAAPVVDKEKQLQEKQLETQNLKQQQLEAQKQQLEAKQKAQQELIEKKKQQIETQKGLFQQLKQQFLGLFQWN